MDIPSYYLLCFPFVSFYYEGKAEKKVKDYPRLRNVYMNFFTLEESMQIQHNHILAELKNVEF